MLDKTQLERVVVCYQLSDDYDAFVTMIDVPINTQNHVIRRIAINDFLQEHHWYEEDEVAISIFRERYALLKLPERMIENTFIINQETGGSYSNQKYNYENNYGFGISETMNPKYRSYDEQLANNSFSLLLIN